MTPVVVAMAFAASISCPSGIVPCNAPPVPPAAIRSPYGVLWMEPLKLKLVAPPRTFDDMFPYGHYGDPIPTPYMPTYPTGPRLPAGGTLQCLQNKNGTFSWGECPASTLQVPGR